MVLVPVGRRQLNYLIGYLCISCVGMVLYVNHNSTDLIPRTMCCNNRTKVNATQLVVKDKVTTELIFKENVTSIRISSPIVPRFVWNKRPSSDIAARIPPSEVLKPHLLRMVSKALSSETSVHDKENKRKILIITTWRSGSTFFGELMSKHVPGSFYTYEPLMTKIRSNSSINVSSVEVLRELFNCNFQHLSYPPDKRWMVMRNKRMFKACQKMKVGKRVFPCLSTSILSSACALFPAHIIKTVRLPATELPSLLRAVPDLTVVALFRDPRGIWNSRLRQDWCAEKECRDMEQLCTRYASDYSIISRLQSSLPQRIFLERYEDVDKAPTDSIQRLMRKLGVKQQEGNMKRMKARSHRRRRKQKPFSLLRSNAWKTELSWTDINDVQTRCEVPMGKLNYTIVDEN